MAGRTKGFIEPAWSWEKEFAKPGFKAVPVSAFAHSNMPLANYWHELAVKDMLVETRLYDNKLPNGTENAHWIAKVLDFAGYMTKIAFEGYDDEVKEDGRNIRWVHFCQDLFRIGYSAENKLPIVPPPEMIEKQRDWRDWIVQRVTGGYTVHPMLPELLAHDNETQLQTNMQVEVLDKSCISRMRLGYVVSVIGHRVHVKYWDANANTEDKANYFWCHELSDSINVVGWSKTIGHDINAPSNYNPPEVSNDTALRKDPGIKIEVGMKLEALDPLNLSVISAASVVKVLKHGYFMIRIESALEQLPTDKKDGFGNSRFCYHITSKLIFPCGFCKQNGITLLPPHGYKPESFDWDAYFKEQGGKPLPLQNLNEPFEHEFSVGAKLEAVDVMEPDLICVATVVKVIGRLLRIRFDGWGEDFDQWADAASCDLFPIGWCRMMGYALQEPRVAEKSVYPPVSKLSLEPVLGHCQVEPLCSDWRFNAAIIEAVCEYLSLEDLKVARRVSKAWAVAGAVPLSKISKITERTCSFNRRLLCSITVHDQRRSYRTYNAICLPHLKQILRPGNSKVFETGFWIRHVELDWNLQDGKPWGTDSEVFACWLQILSCEEFKLLISLKFEHCPTEVVCKLFIPYYLPTRWKQLKFLEFRNSQCFGGMKNVSLNLPAQVPIISELKLEAFGMDIVPNHAYDFSMLKYCSNLQSLKIEVRKGSCPYLNLKQLENLQSAYDQIEAAMEGKILVNLDLWLDLEWMAYDEIVMLDWKAFFSRLVLSNQSSIQHLKLTAVIAASHVSSLFDHLPSVRCLPCIKTCKVTFKTDYEIVHDNLRRTFNHLISAFATRNYLNVQDFLLDIFLGEMNRLTFASKNSTKCVIQANSNRQSEYVLSNLSRDFSNIMKQAYPTINYICCPIQAINPNAFTIPDAFELLESLGKRHVFNVAKLITKWKSLRTRGAEFKIRRDENHDLELFKAMTLSLSSGTWDLDLHSDRMILCFDTIENLPEAWTKIENSSPSWSSVPARFTPAVVANNERSYTFARIFEKRSTNTVTRERQHESKIYSVGAAIANFCTKLWTTFVTNK